MHPQIGGVHIQVLLRSSQLLEQTDHAVMNMITSSDIYDRDDDEEEDDVIKNGDDSGHRKGKRVKL